MAFDAVAEALSVCREIATPATTVEGSGAALAMNRAEITRLRGFSITVDFREVGIVVMLGQLADVFDGFAIEVRDELLMVLDLSVEIFCFAFPIIGQPKEIVAPKEEQVVFRVDVNSVELALRDEMLRERVRELTTHNNSFQILLNYYRFAENTYLCSIISHLW